MNHRGISSASANVFAFQYTYLGGDFTYKFFLVFLLLFTGCAAVGEEKKSLPASAELQPVPTAVITPEPPAPTPPPSLDEQVSFYVGGMTDDEKIGQLFCTAFRQGDITVFNEEMHTAVVDYKIGGVVLFAENMETEEQTIRLIEELQEASDIPLFMAVDEEGGRVSRLSKLYGESTASAAKIGRTENPELAYEEAAEIGRKLSKLGFNLNFAPVADINTNAANTVIGDRAYGSDPELVGEMVASAVGGLREQHIGAVLKHFPGHGDTQEDSHRGRAYVNHDMDRLREVELVPFSRGIEAGALGVMVGHISTPNVTGQTGKTAGTSGQEPAVFSSFLLQEVLKNQMEFSGIIFTDAMDMGAVTNYYTPGEAVLKAFEAGVDMIVMPENLEKAHEALKKELDNGRLDRERLDESVKKIIKSKFMLGLLIEI